MIKKVRIELGGRKKAQKSLKKGLAIGTAAGVALGTVAGILFAPKSGKETRKDIKDNVSDTAKKVTEGIKDTAVKVNQKVSENVKKVYRLKKQVKDEDVVECNAEEDITQDEAQEVK